LKTALIWAAALAAALIPVLKTLRIQPGSGMEDEKVPRHLRWLCKGAAWILMRLPASLFRSGKLTGKGAQAAVHLEPGTDEKTFMVRYYLKNMVILYAGILLICTAGLLLSFAGGKMPVEGNVLERASADGSSRQVALEAQVGETQEELTVTVDPRQYSLRERNALMKKVEAYIDETLPGSNKDLQHVDSDLVFAGSYGSENIAINWIPADYDMIGADGSLVQDAGFDVPAHTAVTAEIVYGDYRETITREITITQFPTDETLKGRLAKAVEEENRHTAEKEGFRLPESIDGTAVVWSYADGTQTAAILFLIAAAAALLIAGNDRKLQQAAEKRRQQLTAEYPDFVYRMSLMLGAGMTARRSWTEIIHIYESDERERKYGSYLYKEMKYTLAGIDAGVPEPEAYAAFARRTENVSYQHFCRLLIQLIRKGSPGMKDMMLREAENAERNRRNNARKIGGKAGLRLLLPMILLLVVVMIVVMVPAVLTM